MDLTFIALLFLAPDVQRLEAKAAKWGYKPQKEVIEAIALSSKGNNVSAEKMLRIALVESGGQHYRVNVNKNKTVDIGAFQINTINRKGICKDLEIENIVGNTECAARLVAMHKKYSKRDPQWLGRFNSKRPDLKEAYFFKLASLGD